MKKITRVALGITSAALLTFGLIGMAQLDAGNKVRLHHGNSAIEINVSIQSLDAHLAHGDFIHTDDYTCACGY